MIKFGEDFRKMKECVKLMKLQKKMFYLNDWYMNNNYDFFFISCLYRVCED